MRFSLPKNSLLKRPAIIGAILLAFAATTGCRTTKQPPRELDALNFAHLNHLLETVQLSGQTVDIVHIYSEAPDYGWVNAPEEGLACVDDAARAAVLFLRQYHHTGEEKYFQKARLLLRFVLTMQAPNGLFYNFLLPDGHINKTRSNSTNRLDFWTARAVWALGEGVLFSKKFHPTFADSLKQALRRVLPQIEKAAAHFPQTEVISGRKYPTWLVNRYAADATSELLLGLVAFQKAAPRFSISPLIERFSRGLILMQYGTWNHAPFSAHLSFPKIWHGWGNAQSQVLAKIGYWFHNLTCVTSARKEADFFFSRLLIEGWQSGFDLTDTIHLHQFPQIAYEVRTVTLGLENLYRVTGVKKYAILAGLAGSWLFGNNPAGEKMYDSKTGRCFDGIESPTIINRNAGAESTLEALLTLQALRDDPIAQRYLFYLNRSAPQILKKEHKILYKYRKYSDKENKEPVVVYLNLQNGQMDVVTAQVMNRMTKNGGKR